MKLYIETERLLLREWTPNDLPTFIKMNQDPEVMEFFPKILDSKESIDFYQRICKEFDKVKYGLFAVERKSDHKFIGYTGLHKADFPANFTPWYRNRMETYKRCMESRLCNRSCQSMPSIWIY